MTRTEVRLRSLSALSLHRHVLIAFVAGVLLVPTAVAQAQWLPSFFLPLPNSTCLANKLKAVGTSLAAHTACSSKEVSTGVANPSCHQKASDKFVPAFAKLETKYNVTSATPCLTFGDQGALETAVTGYAASVPLVTGSAIGKCDATKIKCVGKYVRSFFKCAFTAAYKTSHLDGPCLAKARQRLANGVNGCLDKAAQISGCTHGGNQAVALQAAADEFIEDTLVALGSDPRYVDNGDGTVSDAQTGLMWEKKTTAWGSGANYADPHDVDNTYTWTTGSPWNPDGTAFTDFLVKLNTPPCFAGYCDWRLPSEEGQNSPFTGPKEMEGLLVHQCGSLTSQAVSCASFIFQPAADSYWSATTHEVNPRQAWYVNFIYHDDSVSYTDKDRFAYYVRAVRTGP